MSTNFRLYFLLQWCNKGVEAKQTNWQKEAKFYTYQQQMHFEEASRSVCRTVCEEEEEVPRIAKFSLST